MIKPTAIVVTEWDPKARKNKPVMVATITEDEFSAISEPGTNNALFVDHLITLYNGTEAQGRQTLYEDLIESFERMPHGHGYGGTTEIVEYVGSDKTRVDKIRDKLITLKIEQELS